MNNKEEKFVKVVNKFGGTVGYDVPDLQIHRDFYPGETKEISFIELEKLSFTPGGKVILGNYLQINDPQIAAQILNIQPQPEYYYTKEDIKDLMLIGSLDQFLDCLDFAPVVVQEIIKDMAVELPLNDITKREAIFEKLGFDVTKAIEIKQTKYDGGEEIQEEKQKTSRRTLPPKGKNTLPAPTGRRYTPKE